MSDIEWPNPVLTPKGILFRGELYVPESEIAALKAKLAEAERDRDFKQTDRALAYEMYEKEKARAEKAEADASVMAEAMVKLTVYSEPLTGVGILPAGELAAAVERWRSKP